MELNELLLKLLSSEYASQVTNVLAWIGGLMVTLQAIRPAVQWFVKRTQTEADDRIVQRLYDFFDYLSPDVWNAIKRLAGKKIDG